MKNNRDESWIGDNAFLIWDTIKNWGKCNYPVGGKIPRSEDHEWEKLKNTLEKYGINLNKGGLMFVVRWANMFLDSSCSTAERLGYNPIGFTDDCVKMYGEIIKQLDENLWVENTSNMRDSISVDMRRQITSNLKSMLLKIKSP